MADARHIASRLRKQDTLEMQAMGIEPRRGVLTSYRKAKWCGVVVQGGMPAAIFGVCPSPTPGCGLPWLLGTDSMATLGRPFIQDCKPMLRRMLDTYPVLVNITHRENAVARRWLEWLGFSFYPSASPSTNLFIGFATARGGQEQVAAEWMAQRGFERQPAGTATNYGSSTRTYVHAHGKSPNAPNELLEDQRDGSTYLEPGATAAAAGGHSEVATVGAGQRPQEP